MRVNVEQWRWRPPRRSVLASCRHHRYSSTLSTTSFGETLGWRAVAWSDGQRCGREFFVQGATGDTTGGEKWQLDFGSSSLVPSLPACPPTRPPTNQPAASLIVLGDLLLRL